MGMQVAESSNLQHQVCCKLLDSAGWVPILQSTYTGPRSAPLPLDRKIGSQLAESNNLQHTWCCKLLDSATCIPMQLVGFRLTHLYYVDLLIRITLVFQTSHGTKKKRTLDSKLANICVS